MIRRINAAGLALIKEFEEFKALPYLCPANVATIGYGHAILDPLSGVQLKGVPGLRRANQMMPRPLTEPEAADLLQRDLPRYEWAVEQLVTAPLTENQFSALVSFSYNLGAMALANTTTLKHINAGDHATAAEWLKKWNKADGKVLRGLVRRRAAEVALYLTP